MIPSTLHRLAALAILHSLFMLLYYYAHLQTNQMIAAMAGFELTALFAALPIVAMLILWGGRTREGLILLLGSLPASVAININIQFFIPFWPPILEPAAYWTPVSYVSYMCVLALEVVGILLSYIELRKHHAALDNNAPDQTVHSG